MASAKGKERDVGGRHGLLWSDVYEQLGLAKQGSPLAISSSNAVVFSPATQHRPDGTHSISLHCYAIDNAPQSSSGRKTFPLPLPTFPLPHLPATHLSFAPAANYFLAFFPLAPSPSDGALSSTWSSGAAVGEGGTLALWALSGSKGRSAQDWRLQESWACAAGEEVVDILWLGSARSWTHEDGSATFSRRARCGPPLLPSQHPTFLVLSAAHTITLYHPPSTPGASAGSQALLRTTKCTVDGPGTATWGVMVDSAAGGEEPRRRQRRVRRGRFYIRQNDDSVYLALHSTVLPPPPPLPHAGSASSAAQVSDGGAPLPATGTAEILAGLGIDVGLPGTTGVTPSTDVAVAHDGKSASGFTSEDTDDGFRVGDDDFVEVVEISVDFLVQDHITVSTHPYPPIPLSSSSDLSPSALVTDLVFSELSIEIIAAARPLGLVVAVLDLMPGAEGEPSRPASELHQWRIDKAGGEELCGAFAELEGAGQALGEGLGNETAMFVQSRLFPGAVLAALEPSAKSNSLVTVLEVLSESAADGNDGVSKLVDFATLQDWASFTPAPLRIGPAPGSRVPASFALTANDAFLALFDPCTSSVNFHLHPSTAGLVQEEDENAVAHNLGKSLALALHQGFDVQDLVKVLPLRRSTRGVGRKRKRDEEVHLMEAIVAACWEALCQGAPVDTTPVGLSPWLILLIQLQHQLYQHVGSPRQHIAHEILALARHSSAFERCSSRPKTGQKPQYYIAAAFRLIRETAQAVDTIQRLLLAPIVQTSWDDWSASATVPLPCHFLIAHPTTRILLYSLVKHVKAFGSFFATVRTPLLPPPNVGGGGQAGPSRTVTDAAQGMLADVYQRSALGEVSELVRALEGIDGLLSRNSPVQLVNSTLLKLDMPPDTVAEPQTISQALGRLPSSAIDKAALFSLMS